MAVTSTNGMEVYIATHEVSGVKDVRYQVPERPEIISKPLGADATVIGSGTTGEPWRLEVDVEIDGADTNGQIAMNTAFAAKTVVVLNYYPEGKTVGNAMHSGNAYVKAIPSIGGQGDNVVKEGTYKLAWAAEPTHGTVTA